MWPSSKAFAALPSGLQRTSATTRLGSPRFRSSQAASTSGPSTSSIRLRRDVLVQVEQVPGVVGPLHLHEPVVAPAVVRAHPTLVVGGHEVDVPTLLGERRD